MTYLVSGMVVSLVMQVMLQKLDSVAFQIGEHVTWGEGRERSLVLEPAII